ncbi:MAG TPA: hypothetical protein VL691_13830 [Vicinamibacteria bacterium]|nr:hypothetical protein [Vicinamibacteria bacterium]
MRRTLLSVVFLLAPHLALAQLQLPGLGGNFPDACKLLSEAEVSAAMGAKLQSLGQANRGAEAMIGLPVPMCLWSGDRLEVVLYVNPVSPRGVPRTGENPTPLEEKELGDGAFYTTEGKDRVWLYARGFYLSVQNPRKPPLDIARSLARKVAAKLEQTTKG